jgi:signal peptidase I
MSMKNLIIETVETIVVSIAVISIIYSTVASIEVVLGSSMEPNFHTNERILVEHVTRYFKPFKRGEVVVITPPEENKHFIKRIVGVPGDVFKIKDCKVQISRDGVRYELEEPYLDKTLCTTGGYSIIEGRGIRLNDNEYIVLGDNRPLSVDSRSFGIVGKERIIGRVIFMFWPLNKIGFTK